jgi:hypothetical protein
MHKEMHQGANGVDQLDDLRYPTSQWARQIVSKPANLISIIDATQCQVLNRQNGFMLIWRQTLLIGEFDPTTSPIWKIQRTNNHQ